MTLIPGNLYMVYSTLYKWPRIESFASLRPYPIKIEPYSIMLFLKKTDNNAYVYYTFLMKDQVVTATILKIQEGSIKFVPIIT